MDELVFHSGRRLLAQTTSLIGFDAQLAQPSCIHTGRKTAVQCIDNVTTRHSRPLLSPRQEFKIKTCTLTTLSVMRQCTLAVVWFEAHTPITVISWQGLFDGTDDSIKLRRDEHRLSYVC